MQIKKYHQASGIWLQFKDALNGYIYKKIKNTESAEEINQQVLMKVVNSCCSNTHIRNVRSWLFQIAHNTTIDYLKNSKKNIVLETDFEEELESSIYDEIAPFVTTLINSLPPKYALPLKMADIDEMKQQVIAEKLNLSLSATKSRIQRARKLLKQEVLLHFKLDSKE